jgi:hypothetical protein
MPEFKISITEILKKSFTIKADSLEDALNIAEEKYSKGEDEFVLDYNDLITSNIEEVDINKGDHYGI